MQTEPAGPSPWRTWAPRVGVVLLLVVASLLVLLPVLWPLRPTPQVPASQPIPPAQPEAPSLVTRPDVEATQPAEPEAPASRPAEPVHEVRRVQQGPATPIAPPSSGPATASNQADEWNRSEQARERAIQQFGGNRQTETAVEMGLTWLAAHQSPEGLWDRFQFDRQCPPNDRCLGEATERSEDDLRAGISGLSLLAFLGAGYTNHDGSYQEVVGKAVDALLALQQPHGGFSPTDSMAGYNDPVATLALAECYALTHEARLVAPLQRAVQRLVQSQQPLGGWDYLPTPATGRDDTSITAWMLQALHACRAIGIDVPPETFIRAALHLVRATEADGQVRYADSGIGFDLDENLRPSYRYGPGMLAAGLMGEQLLGWRLDGGMPLRQRTLLLADPPSEARARGRDTTQLHSEYYWYYGTIAMFQRGGTDWERWNASLRDAILPMQDREMFSRTRKRHSYGSWRPYGRNWGMWGRRGGRVYTTAICTLTLEIYYRHTPAFLTGQAPYAAADWQRFISDASPAERETAVKALAQLRVEIAEPVLVDLLANEGSELSVAAAVALAWLDSPVGIPRIEEALATQPAWAQEPLTNALERARAVAALPAVEGHVRLYDAGQRLATLELPRSYVGMKASVQRDDQTSAHLQVIQRFTGRNVVVAELLDSTAMPAAGDRVIAR